MLRPLGASLLVLALLAGSARAQRSEVDLRRELQATWIHGVTEADARAVASEADVPSLLRLLDDPDFERPDNVAAFLVHLADESCVPALSDLARRTSPPASPESDRARLIVPQALAALVQRSGGAGLDALAELANDPTIPEELAGLASGELGRLGLPGFVEPPRFREPQRPSLADGSSRVEAIPLTFANHVDLDDPMTAERLDLNLSLANTRVGRSDFDTDVSCCVQVERSGPARTFGSPGDGLDVIDDAAEFTLVRNEPSARVKIVRLIRHCFGQDAPNIGGCAEISGDSMIVIRLGSATVEGLVWFHEYGHNTGIAQHDPDDRFIMSAVTGFQDVAVSAGQCLKFHEPEPGTAIGLIDRGPCQDLDGDEVQDGIDNCLGLANKSQVDFDNDGQGDPCDADDDGDGVPDGEDQCPGLPDGEDTDGDGVPSCLDGCPNDPNKTAPGECGCGILDLDADGDGLVNCLDGCPFDPDKIAPGACGCGTPDDDADGDQTPDCQDGCPLDPAKIAPGACGCGSADEDFDQDGTADCNDGCPLDPDKVAPGACGCGAADTDVDDDGTADCNDACPDDPAKQELGDCGCGLPELDGDSDGIADCLQCTLGDAWPPGGDGELGLADWIALRREIASGSPGSARCLDLAPVQAACEPSRLCSLGGDGLDQLDEQLLRALVAEVQALDCRRCGVAAATGAERRRPGDVAPRGGPDAEPTEVGDGLVDIADVLQLLRWVVSLDEAPGVEERLRSDVAPLFAGDVGGDGFVDVNDVLLVLRVVVGLQSLDWPLRSSPIVLSVEAPVVAVQVVVAELPAWARPEAGVPPACQEGGVGALDLGAERLALSCAWDPATVDGALSGWSLRYRAPETFPAGGAPAPSLAATAVGNGLDAVAAVASWD